MTTKKIYKEIEVTSKTTKELHDIFNILVHGNWNRDIEELCFAFLDAEDYDSDEEDLDLDLDDHTRYFCRMVIKGYAKETVWKDFMKKVIK